MKLLFHQEDDKPWQVIRGSERPQVIGVIKKPHDSDKLVFMPRRLVALTDSDLFRIAEFMISFVLGGPFDRQVE